MYLRKKKITPRVLATLSYYSKADEYGSTHAFLACTRVIYSVPHVQQLSAASCLQVCPGPWVMLISLEVRRSNLYPGGLCSRVLVGAQ